MKRELFMELKVTRLDTPFGILIITASDIALESIKFFEDDETRLAKTEKSPILEKARKEFEHYFTGDLKEFTIPLSVKGTPFQEKCWSLLKKIPYGKTISYKEQAVLVGGENYCRAVAGANNKNKFPIIIPCHRVIGSNGSLVGYAGGLWVKKILLE